MSLQNLTLTTLRKSLPDSVIEDLSHEIQKHQWVCSVGHEDGVTVDILNPTDDPIRSMIENEKFIRQVLCDHLVHCNSAIKEIFYIFQLKYQLNWKTVQQILQPLTYDWCVYNLDDPDDNWQYSITEIEPYDHTYQLNDLELDLKSRNLVTSDQYEELIEFIMDGDQAKTKTWTEIFVMNEDEQKQDFENGEIFRKERNRTKIKNIDWTNLNVYTLPELRGFVKQLSPAFQTFKSDKDDLIRFLKSNCLN